MEDNKRQQTHTQTLSVICFSVHRHSFNWIYVLYHVSEQEKVKGTWESEIEFDFSVSRACSCVCVFGNWVVARVATKQYAEKSFSQFVYPAFVRRFVRLLQEELHCVCHGWMGIVFLSLSPSLSTCLLTCVICPFAPSHDPIPIENNFRARTQNRLFESVYPHTLTHREILNWDCPCSLFSVLAFGSLVASRLLLYLSLSIVYSW